MIILGNLAKSLYKSLVFFLVKKFYLTLLFFEEPDVSHEKPEAADYVFFNPTQFLDFKIQLFIMKLTSAILFCKMFSWIPLYKSR